MTEKVFKETKTGNVVEIPGIHPLYLASKDTTDPQILSYVEALFWTHSFKDHSEIMDLLLPDKPELAEYKKKSKEHIQVFDKLNQRAKTVEPGDEEIKIILDEAEHHGKMMAEQLSEMIKKQDAAEIRTLMWLSFMDHLLREAEYFLGRKKEIANNKIEYKKSEIIPFWLEIMAEHTMFTAHLLDPDEIDVIDQAWEANSKLYEDLEAFEKNDDAQRLMSDLEGLIIMKANLVDGVTTGEISSIIIPELADHMRHEAIYFRDILERAK